MTHLLVTSDKVTRCSFLAHACTDRVAVGHLDAKKYLRETECTFQHHILNHTTRKSVSNETKLVSLRKLYHIAFFFGRCKYKFIWNKNAVSLLGMFSIRWPKQPPCNPLQLDVESRQCGDECTTALVWGVERAKRGRAYKWAYKRIKTLEAIQVRCTFSM